MAVLIYSEPQLKQICALICLQPASKVEAATQQRLQQTAIAQPALFIIRYAFAKLCGCRGVRGGNSGHSIREYQPPLVWLAFLSEDAVKLVATRGRLSATTPRKNALYQFSRNQDAILAGMKTCRC